MSTLTLSILPLLLGINSSFQIVSVPAFLAPAAYEQGLLDVANIAVAGAVVAFLLILLVRIIRFISRLLRKWHPVGGFRR